MFSINIIPESGTVLRVSRWGRAASAQPPSRPPTPAARPPSCPPLPSVHGATQSARDYLGPPSHDPYDFLLAANVPCRSVCRGKRERIGALNLAK